MTFVEQLKLALLDKGVLALILLVMGFCFNKLIEAYKFRRALENELAKVRDIKKIEFLEKQLTSFYYPIYFRLLTDNVVWTKILDKKYGENQLKKEMGSLIEEKVIIPNHDEILKILQQNYHLAVHCEDFSKAVSMYVRHVAVYKSLRQANCHDQFPKSLGEPWPEGFFTMIETGINELQKNYDDTINCTYSFESGRKKTNFLWRVGKRHSLVRRSLPMS